jgi:outer membrane protein OmpA-like peptidoglycan-associated protein
MTTSQTQGQMDAQTGAHTDPQTDSQKYAQAPAQTTGAPVQAAPRRLVEDAWGALNRRYAIGAAVLAGALVLLWMTGNGPGALRAAAPAVSADAAPATASREVTGSVAGGSAATAAAANGGAGTAAAPVTAPANGAMNGGKDSGKDSGTASPPASGSARPATDAPAAAALPRAVPGAPVARLYFEPDQAWPTGEIGPRLAPVLARLKAEPGTKALVSGFHDRRGSAERNATLALRRAQAVRRVLIREGIAADRIVLAKPQQTQGSGADREARRVEVTVAR